MHGVLFICDSDDVKKALFGTYLLVAVEEPFCCRDNPSLLLSVNAVLWWSLHAQLAGLHFYKMYSVTIHRNYVNLKVPASEVSLQDYMSVVFKESACNIFPIPAYSLFVTIVTLHSPSSFFNDIVLDFFNPSPMLIV